MICIRVCVPTVRLAGTRGGGGKLCNKQNWRLRKAGIIQFRRRLIRGRAVQCGFDSKCNQLNWVVLVVVGTDSSGVGLLFGVRQ